MDNSIIKYIFEHEGSIRMETEPFNRIDLEKDLGVAELETTLINQLNRQQQELFEDILSLHFSINDEYISTAFQKGMIFGIKMMLEVFNYEK